MHLPEDMALGTTTITNSFLNNMYNPLFIYPNFTFSNPTQKQFERFLLALRNEYNLNIVTRRGPRELTHCFNPYFSKGSYGVYLNAILKRTFCDLAYLPDVLRWTVNPLLSSAVTKAIKNETKIDFITTLSYPLSCHLIGYEFKKKHEIPWVAIFYDPWTDNPYRKFKTNFFKSYDAQLEKKIARYADAIIHTNDIIANIWKDRYGSLVQNKVFTLPFCYTNEMLNSLPNYPNSLGSNKIVLSYIGQSVGDRNLQDIIYAIYELEQEGFDPISKLEIRIIGIPYQPDKDKVKKYNLENYFKFYGMMPVEELEKYYNESDIFIVIDAPSKSNIFFPSKLMDYFYYQKPILGITPNVGVTNDLLTKSGNFTITNGNIKGLKCYLKNILINGIGFLSFDKNYYNNFHPQHISSEFSAIINKII